LYRIVVVASMEVVYTDRRANRAWRQ